MEMVRSSGSFYLCRRDALLVYIFMDSFRVWKFGELDSLVFDETGGVVGLEFADPFRFGSGYICRFETG